MDIPSSAQTPESPLNLSRRERREQRRAELRAAQKGFARRRTAWRVVMWAGVAAVVVGLGWGMVKLASRVPAVSNEGILTVPVSASDNIQGPASASVTLVEYSDLQCPACAAYQPLLKQVFAEPELAGKIRFVYRHFPLTEIHKNAQQAAQAAQAAALQGKFWEFHDKMFAEQSAWAGLSGPAAGDKFKEYASALGLNVEQWQKDRDSKAVKDKVDADAAGGNAAGVNSTPTFFINGAKMTPPQSYADFKQQLVNAIHAVPK